MSEYLCLPPHLRTKESNTKETKSQGPRGGLGGQLSQEFRAKQRGTERGRETPLTALALQPEPCIQDPAHGETQEMLVGRMAGRRLGGSMIEYLPLAQVMIPGSLDQVSHWGPHRELASPSACVSASLCVSHE